jgi:histidine triad (HIT) family protein
VNTSTCVFCRIAARELKAHIVHEDDSVIVFLDNGPLFPGHCLVCPRKHYDTMMDLPPGALQPLFSTVQLISRALEQALGAEGSFVAVNNKVSQSVPHLHVHVMPRRRGDGMKGFFWPRRPYKNEAEAEETRRALAEAVGALLSPHLQPGSDTVAR